VANNGVGPVGPDHHSKKADRKATHGAAFSRIYKICAKVRLKEEQLFPIRMSEVQTAVGKVHRAQVDPAAAIFGSREE
jgi:hypothetical protein